MLLLDPTTTKIVSMVYSQTQILEQEVYLVEQLGKKVEAMVHFKAIVFIQPTSTNVKLLIQEFQNPKYKEYHIFFTNIVPQSILTELARNDEHEVVRGVQEYYADFMAVNEDLFVLGAENSLSLSSPKSRSLTSGQIHDRNVNGVLSVLLALKKRPAQIRYQGESDLARRIASDIAICIEKDGIFDFRKQEGPLLLILDRRDDPITPLLTQFTYQAMVHELIGLNNNRVKLKGAPNISKDLEEVVLSSTQDAFFAKMKHSHMGDLGVAVKNLMDDYQRQAKMNEKLSSIEDMQSFMERYPAFRSQSINCSKHVALMGELMRLTDKGSLLDVSGLEQDFAISNDHALHKRQLFEKLMDSKIQIQDKLRLSLLFILKYESYNDQKEIKTRLNQIGVKPKDVQLIDALIDYAGDAHRAPGLFSAGSLVSQIGKVFTDITTVGGMENHYTQHQPLLSTILESILKGKLKDATFPIAHVSGTNTNAKPSEVIVFIVGGVTYEEACKVSQFNSSNAGMKVILGGSVIHNSRSFLKEVFESFH